jgi:hypothetical protein
MPRAAGIRTPLNQWGTQLAVAALTVAWPVFRGIGREISQVIDFIGLITPP